MLGRYVRFLRETTRSFVVYHITTREKSCLFQKKIKFLPNLSDYPAEPHTLGLQAQVLVL